MTGSTSGDLELQALIDLVCDGTPKDHDIVRLEELLRGNANAKRLYLTQIRLDRWLRLEFTHRIQEPEASDSPSLPYSFLGIPSRNLFAGYFADAPIAYLVSTMIIGIGLLIMAVVPVSQSVQSTADSKPIVKHQQIANQKKSVVGRITGMADCKWNNTNAGVVDGDSISLGRELSLASGLVEITYATGAKVILQGPVQYKVESKNGGFLSIGKLTGKMENDTAKGFVVRTPTAIVTDLGTEFSVEVVSSGRSNIAVHRGIVELQRVGNSQWKHCLKAGDAMCVRSDGPPVRISGGSMSFFHSLSNPLETFSISTRDGCGADAFVRDGNYENKNFGGSQEVIVKNGVSGYHRKTYLRFDLQALAGKTIIGSKFEWTLETTHADRTLVFLVYGLKDGAAGDGLPENGGWCEGRGEDEEHASNQGIHWRNAPANVLSCGDAFSSDAVFLGTFWVTPDLRSGEVACFSSRQFTDWLKTKTNGTATLMIARKEKGNDIRVMMFAAKEHLMLPPPRLLVTVAPASTSDTSYAPKERKHDAVHATQHKTNQELVKP